MAASEDRRCATWRGTSRRSDRTFGHVHVLEDVVCLVSPKVLEPCGRQFRVSDRVADIPMPKVILNGSRIVAIARELVSRTMSQHVRMNLEGQSRLLTRALHQPIEPIG